MTNDEAGAILFILFMASLFIPILLSSTRETIWTKPEVDEDENSAIYKAETDPDGEGRHADITED